jgi:hypothetical protein
MLKTQKALSKNTETLTEVGGSSYTEVLNREKKNQPVVKRAATPIEYVRSILGEVDEVIDELFARKKKTTFNLTTWLADKKVTNEHVELIRATYTKDRDELVSALEGTDKDLVEGYRFLNDRQKQVIIDFYNNLIDACIDFVNLLKRKKALNRKPRVKKPVTAGKQVKTLKFLRESDEYAIASVAPEHLVGALQAWVFNIKTRKLTKYVASDRGGFTVKGSTLQNFDEKLSETKMLRKPEETLKTVVGGKKRELNKLMDSLTTKAAPANGRFNGATVILTVLK